MKLSRILALVGALLLGLSTAPAFAQYSAGQVLRASDINNIITRIVALETAGVVPGNGTVTSAKLSGALTMPGAVYIPSGNLGVGTSTPFSRFHVIASVTGAAPAATGTADAAVIARFANVNTALDLGQYASGDMWLQARNYTALGTQFNLALQPNGGNLGVGKVPTTTLDVNGVAQATALALNGVTTTPTIGFFAPSTNNLAFSTAGAEKARIDASGNFGIGKTPTAKLDVNGSIAGSSATITGIVNASGYQQGGTALEQALPAFTGDSGGGGAKGVVPAPAVGDAAAGKYLAAGGTWSTPGQSKIVKQIIYAPNSAGATGTGTIPFDDTIPQITEGTEFMTATIAPTSASSTLIITVTANISQDATAVQMACALYQDANVNALKAVAQYMPNADMYPINFKHVMTAGTTAATTFRVRCGANTATTTRFNGWTSAVRLFGGVMASDITIQEISP
ncbi:hypothetical protein GCM10007036_14580 [Alsobacter metallidurans]|uniref:Uncharacterized protein n=1 Tax=Alsobacter metallidurans TaxID=340221 RepID=A0A917MGH2_9HYPH|nr:hypothetical protein [Alsobacter metallidurans]GGH14937.1 hypothetical protein GCM10007036_14580 [Alsobacter metallidurans]